MAPELCCGETVSRRRHCGALEIGRSDHLFSSVDGKRRFGLSLASSTRARRIAGLAVVTAIAAGFLLSGSAWLGRPVLYVPAGNWTAWFFLAGLNAMGCVLAAPRAWLQWPASVVCAGSGLVSDIGRADGQSQSFGKQRTVRLDMDGVHGLVDRRAFHDHGFAIDCFGGR